MVTLFANYTCYEVGSIRQVRLLLIAPTKIIISVTRFKILLQFLWAI